MEKFKQIFILDGKVIDKIKLNLILFLFVFVFLSCSTNKRFVEGDYFCKTKISTGILKLQNNTFELRYNVSLNSFISKGKYDLDKDCIYLNSYSEFNSGYIKINKIYNEKINYIKLILDDGSVIENFPIFLDDEKYITNSKGLVDITKKINKVNIDYIFLNEKNREIFLEYEENCSYILEIVPIDYSKRYFKNLKASFKNGKIILEDLVYLKK